MNEWMKNTFYPFEKYKNTHLILAIILSAHFVVRMLLILSFIHPPRRMQRRCRMTPVRVSSSLSEITWRLREAQRLGPSIADARRVYVVIRWSRWSSFTLKWLWFSIASGFDVIARVYAMIRWSCWSSFTFKWRWFSIVSGFDVIDKVTDAVVICDVTASLFLLHV